LLKEINYKSKLESDITAIVKNPMKKKCIINIGKGKNTGHKNHGNVKNKINKEILSKSKLKGRTFQPLYLTIIL